MLSVSAGNERMDTQKICFLGPAAPRIRITLEALAPWIQFETLSTVEEGNLERVSNFEQKKSFLF